MTRPIDSLIEIASDYDAIVFDQWGVLHDGTKPYPKAVRTLEALKNARVRMAVLSNSGKRSSPNTERIAGMGFAPQLFDTVMTSGEALWTDIQNGTVPERVFFPIEARPGDSKLWAQGLSIDLTADISQADAVLLMGLPDGSSLTAWQDQLDTARSHDLTVYCSNPDRKSPRKDGVVISPGALAFAYQDMGGKTVFYGKPHRPVFSAVETALGAQKLLMVGDSLEHDIAGAHAAGWDSLLVQGGLYFQDFANSDAQTTLAALIETNGYKAPTYQIEMVQ